MHFPISTSPSCPLPCAFPPTQHHRTSFLQPRPSLISSRCRCDAHPPQTCLQGKADLLAFSFIFSNRFVFLLGLASMFGASLIWKILFFVGHLDGWKNQQKIVFLRTVTNWLTAGFGGYSPVFVKGGLWVDLDEIHIRFLVQPAGLVWFWLPTCLLFRYVLALPMLQ